MASYQKLHNVRDLRRVSGRLLRKGERDFRRRSIVCLPPGLIRTSGLAVLAACLLAVPGFAQNDELQPAAKTVASLSEMSLDDLMQIKVVTASRSEQTLPRSTSVMSVITARDIERAGYRTVYEALARVPGFFPTSQATWKIVGSRGLLSDGNDHFLLLIDGHSQNSILSHGFQQQDQMPVLEKVARIEIIRGPGSVLWGASAAHAIINIVTRDQIQDGASSQLTTSYSGIDGLWNINLLKNIRMGDAKGILSASYWQAKGYDAPDQPNVKFPWGASTNFWPRLDAQNPGFELYLKLKQTENQQILARVTQTSVPYPWDSWSYDPAGGIRPGAELRMRKAYLEYQNIQPYTDRLKVQYTVYGDMLLQNRFPLLNTHAITDRLDTSWIEDQSREELAFGAEAMGSYQFTSAHTIRFGTKYVHTIAGPNRGFRFDTGTNLPMVPAAGQEQVPVIDIPSGTDNNVGVYAEDKLTFNSGKTDVFAGARTDYNDWRERRTVILPRAGIIHSLSDSLTLKYVFNTGHLRPNAAYSKSDGRFYRAPSKTIEDVSVVDRGERVRSHDVQLTFAKNRNYLVGTLYRMAIDNFISWETKLDLGYRDMGKAYSTGTEIEGRYYLTSSLAFTGNYAFARAYLRTIPTGVDINGVSQLLEGALTNADREWLNYPAHTWNAGFDYVFLGHQSLNSNLRGWHTMKIVAPFNQPNAGSYDQLSGEVYLDVSYLAKDVLPKIDFRVSGTNLLNNTGPVGMAINNGVFSPPGRSVGFQISRRF